MDTKTLRQYLESPDATLRLKGIQIVGLVEEVAALPILAHLFQTEADSTVKEAVNWAGARVSAARQRGYSTFDEIYREFRLTPLDQMSEQEAALIRQMNNKLDTGLHQMQQSAATKQIAIQAGATAAMTAISGVIGTGMGGFSAPAVSLSSSLSADGGLNQYKGPSRIPPKRPMTDSVAIWIKRLTTDSKPENRVQATKEMIEWNNPALLVDLSAAYRTEANPTVKAAIERAAKMLYWGLVYWEMSQDGRLEPAINQKAASTPAS